MDVYPATLPCPLINGYQYSVDMGVARDNLIGGNQRRMFNMMPHYFTANFPLTTLQITLWQSFMLDHVDKWFTIRMASMYSAPKGDIPTPHTVRVTSESLVIAAIDNKNFRASVVLELSPIEFMGAIA